MSPIPIAFHVSGGGSTLQAILKSINRGILKDRFFPACVIASAPDIRGIERAKEEGLKEDRIFIIPPKEYPTEEAFGEELIKFYDLVGAQFASLNGWLPRIPRNVVSYFGSKNMRNQHPGPLDPGQPDFGGKGMYGRRVHAARLYFVRKTKRDLWTEVVSQEVHEHFDEGRVVASERVPILPDDTVYDLQARALPIEHEVQIKALLQFSEDSVIHIQRDRPLVSLCEIPILEEAKRVAKIFYPKG